MVGRWVSVEGQDPDGVVVPSIELAEDGTASVEDECGSRQGTWNAGGLDLDPVDATECQPVELDSFALYDDGTLRFEGSLAYRRLDQVEGPDREDVVGAWVTPSGQFGIELNGPHDPRPDFRGKAFIDACLIDWSLGYGVLAVVRWDQCDYYEEPYEEIVATLAAGADARLDGDHLFATSNGRTIHLVRPADVGFPEEVIGTWSADVPEAGGAHVSITYEADGTYGFDACNSGGGRWWVEGDTVRTYASSTDMGCSGYLGVLDFIGNDAPLPTGD